MKTRGNNISGKYAELQRCKKFQLIFFLSFEPQTWGLNNLYYTYEKHATLLSQPQEPELSALSSRCASVLEKKEQC